MKMLDSSWCRKDSVSAGSGNSMNFNDHMTFQSRSRAKLISVLLCLNIIILFFLKRKFIFQMNAGLRVRFQISVNCFFFFFNICVLTQSYPTLLQTLALQTFLSMGFSRQESWTGWPCPPPRDLPNQGTKPRSPALVGRFFTTEPPGKPFCYLTC